MGENYEHNYDNVSLIVLQGKENSGKTTTLNKLINQLISDGWKEIKSQFIPENGKKDKIIVLKKSVTIIVQTAGDIESNYINYAFHFIDKYNPIILVCPCKTKGQTVDCLFKQTKFKNSNDINKSIINIEHTENPSDEEKNKKYKDKVEELIKAISQKFQEFK